jgi:hypothetical protein
MKNYLFADGEQLVEIKPMESELAAKNHAIDLANKHQAPLAKVVIGIMGSKA